MAQLFVPGDRVRVVDGTFSDRQGVVVSADEARRLCRTSGGEQPPLKATQGIVCVVLPIFGREVPVCLQPFQLASAEEQ